VFGVGKGNYRLDEDDVSKLGGKKLEELGFEASSREQSEIHSTYISLLCETGTIGLIIFLSIMSVFIIKLVKCLVFVSSVSQNYLIAAALLVALIGMLAQGAVANVEETRGLWVLLGLIYAVTAKVINYPRQ
jgi:O-antigen ligase